MTKFKALLVAGTAMATLFAGANQAEASYAFASTQLSNVRFTLFDNSTNPPTFPAITGASGTISVNGSANFILGSTIFPGMSNASPAQNLPTFPASPTPVVLGISQATSGPNVPFFAPPLPWPAPISALPYAPQEPAPGMVGARATAVIGAATAAAGGGETKNVAEASAGDGTAQSANLSSIAFSLSQAATVALSFTALVQLIVDTSFNGDSASAAISNIFTISRCANSSGSCGSQTQVFRSAPDAINQSFTSLDGGSDGLGPVSFNFTGANAITTGLAAGQYRVSLASTAVVNTVTAPIVVPAPFSLALFGMGLAGLVAIRGARAQRA